MANINNLKSRFRKGLYNPIESTRKEEWCKTCQAEVDTEVHQSQFKGIFVYRKCCLRCGKVLQYGVHKSAMTSTNPMIMRKVSEWIKAAGRDRR